MWRKRPDEKRERSYGAGAESFTAKFRGKRGFSANFLYPSIIFGKASLAEGEEAKAALLKLVEKLAPDFVEKGKSCIESGKMPASVIKITPEYITGKANK